MTRVVTSTLFVFFGMGPWGSSAASSCLAQPPNEEFSGEIVLEYEISKECEITNVHYTKNTLGESFEEFAKCQAIRATPVVRPGAEVISEAEYRKRLSEYRKANPNRYYNKSVRVTLGTSGEAVLTCYFNGDRKVTSYEIDVLGEVRTATAEEIDRLPIQQFHLRYETKF